MMDRHEAANRSRLIALLDRVKPCKAPPGWRLVATIAVGGLTEIGFSKHAELLLVLSHQGRGVVDCGTGQKVARDDAPDGPWLAADNLSCSGIGPLAGETISMAGLHGGGLPTFTAAGESLALVWPEWPRARLIFCAAFKDVFVEGDQAGCCLVTSEHIRAFGFSWSGHSFAYATGSDVQVFAREAVARSATDPERPASGNLP